MPSLLEGFDNKTFAPLMMASLTMALLSHGRDHDDVCRRIDPKDLLEGGKPVHFRHGDVHGDDIGGEGLVLLNRNLSVLSLATTSCALFLSIFLMVILINAASSTIMTLAIAITSNEYAGGKRPKSLFLLCRGFGWPARSRFDVKRDGAPPRSAGILRDKLNAKPFQGFLTALHIASSDCHGVVLVCVLDGKHGGSARYFCLETGLSRRRP